MIKTNQHKQVFALLIAAIGLFFCTFAKSDNTLARGTHQRAVCENLAFVCCESDFQYKWIQWPTEETTNVCNIINGEPASGCTQDDLVVNNSGRTISQICHANSPVSVILWY